MSSTGAAPLAGTSGTFTPDRAARPAGRGHLKQLSLSTSSLASPGSPVSPSPRNLRLSLAGSASSSRLYRSPDDAGPSSAPPSDLAFTTSPASSPLAERNRPGFRPGSEPRGHARRTSSIAYSSGNGARGELGAVTSPSSTRGTHSPTTSISTRARPSSIIAPSGLGLSGVVQESAQGLVEASEEPERPEGRDAEATGFLSPSKSSMAMGAAPTLTEVHADLLSFIAKKERKCLDLREELKRHESELSQLKKKWESIVARSLNPPPQPSPTPSRSPVPPPASLASPALGSQPLHSPHSLDVGLIGSFENPPLAPNQDDIDREIGESVQAAKAWVGGVLGKVMDAVSGIEDSPTKSRSLDILREEEEEEGERTPTVRAKHATTISDSAASASSVEDRDLRRDSRISSVSTAASDISDASSYGWGSRTRPGSGDLGASMPASGSNGLLSSILSPPASSSSTPIATPSSAPPPASITRLQRSEASHSRRRSTFDMLGAAAGGGWSSLGKKFAAVTESETFKGTKRATMQFVDTFEKTLTDTLGPLDPPSPSMGHSTAPPREGEYRKMTALNSPPVGSEEEGKRGSMPSPSVALPSGIGMFSAWRSAGPSISPHEEVRSSSLSREGSKEGRKDD